MGIVVGPNEMGGHRTYVRGISTYCTVTDSGVRTVSLSIMSDSGWIERGYDLKRYLFIYRVTVIVTIKT